MRGEGAFIPPRRFERGGGRGGGESTFGREEYA